MGMYDGIRNISVEIMATEKWKNQGKCITRKMTKAEIEKYGIGPGGKDMARPKGSKNKPKVDNDQKITLKQSEPKAEVKQSEALKEAKEIIKSVVEAKQGEYHKEEVIDKMFKDAGFKGLIEEKETPGHIDEFREEIRMRHMVACKHVLRDKIWQEFDKTSNEKFKESIHRMMDYCQEVLNQIEKDL